MRVTTGIFALLLIAMAPSAQSELLNGTSDLITCQFDFSEQFCGTDLCRADVYLAQVDPPGCTAVAACWTGSCPDGERSVFAILVGMSLDEVDVAPEDPSVYGCVACAVRDAVYVVRTAEGLYAKFAFTDWPEGSWTPNSWAIEYYVQTNGTRDLGSVPVEPATWGAIKQLYAKD